MRPHINPRVRTGSRQSWLICAFEDEAPNQSRTFAPRHCQEPRTSPVLDVDLHAIYTKSQPLPTEYSVTE